MKKTCTSKQFFFLLLLYMPLMQGYAQINCSSGHFYGWGSDGAIHSLTLSGGVVTLGNAASPAVTSSRFGLAIADLGSGNSFYSSGSTSLALDYDILEFSTSMWSTLFANPYPNSLHNAAGKGNFLYYHYIGSSNQTGNARHSKIFRYDGISLPVIFSDSAIFMKVADIAVDNNGNIYFFSDTIQYPNTNVSRLNIISPTGSLLATYPVSFDGDNAYGCFISDSIIYVGLGPSNLIHPNTLLPVIVSSTSATLGVPIPVPSPVIGGTIGNPIHLQFSDLASCADANVHFEGSTVGISAPVEKGIHLFPNPVSTKLTLELPNPDNKNTSIKIYNALGKIILSQQVNSAGYTIDMTFEPKGIYIAEINRGNQVFFEKIIHQ